MKTETLISIADSDALDALREWAYLATRGTVAAGGTGQTRDQRAAAADAWDALDDTARLLHAEIVAALAKDIRAAEREYLDAYGDDAPDARALLGDDWPAWDYVTPGDVEAAAGERLSLPPHEQVAEWCGVSVSAVRQWSAGYTACAAHHVDTIARQGDVDRGDLVEYLADRWRAKHPEET